MMYTDNLDKINVFLDGVHMICCGVHRYEWPQAHIYTRTCKLIEIGLSPQILSQGSVEWFDARRGRITASYAGAIRSLKNGKSLIERILGNTPPFTTPALQHGTFFESVARAMYCNQEHSCHKGLTVRECGLFVLDEAPILGASPDGIVTCSCHPPRLLEIKCSSKYRNLDPLDIPNENAKYHLKISNGKLNLKQNSDWFYQVQFQMGVSKYERCDFVIHTLKDIAVIPVEFDSGVWEMLKNKSIEVFKGSILSRLMALT